MNQSELIRASLASVRKELREVLPHLSDELLGWAPTPGMRTVKGQLVEILATESESIKRLKGSPRRSYEEFERPFLEIPNFDGLIAELDAVRAVTLDYLDGLTAEDLDSIASVSDEFASWLELDKIPVAEVLRFIARHEYYHVGQLVSYVWSRGDDPYTWD